MAVKSYYIIKSFVVINGTTILHEEIINSFGKESVVYVARNAGAVIHTHSKSALLVTLLFPGKEFRISHLEMIKGIKNQQTDRYYRYDEELVIPIIENTCFECDLEESMAAAIKTYPQATAVLVRRHGIYVWGDTWQQAKTQCECYDYIFDVVLKMKTLGVLQVKSNEIK